MIFESLGGEKLLAHDAERMSEPASLVKLATSAAAIERLAPSTAFRLHLFRRSQDLLVREMLGVCSGPAPAPLACPVGNDDLPDVVIERPPANPPGPGSEAVSNR